MIAVKKAVVSHLFYCKITNKGLSGLKAALYNYERITVFDITVSFMVFYLFNKIVIIVFKNDLLALSLPS